MLHFEDDDENVLDLLHCGFALAGGLGVAGPTIVDAAPRLVCIAHELLCRNAWTLLPLSRSRGSALAMLFSCGNPSTSFAQFVSLNRR